MARSLSRRQLLLLPCVTQDSVELEDIAEDEQREEDNLVFPPASPGCRVLEVILL